MQRLLQKIINRIIHLLFKIIRIQHKKRYARGEGIEPFISGDTFRDLADLRIDRASTPWPTVRLDGVRLYIVEFY